MQTERHPKTEPDHVLNGASRRAMIGALGFLVPALAMATDRQEALARRRKRKRQRCCTNGKQECGGACRDLQTDSANCGQCNQACAAGDQCVAGLCLTAASTCGAVDPCGAVNDCGSSPFCKCRSTMAGAIRCSVPPPTTAISSGNCTTDEQCIARFGHGAHCTRCCSGLGGCAVPCPH